VNAGEARAFHDEITVVDLHADTPKLMATLGYDLCARHRPQPVNAAGHVDLPRARDGGLGAQVFGLWTFPYPQRGCAAAIHAQLDALEAAAAAAPNELAVAAAPAAIRAARAAGRLAVMTGIEGAHALEGDLDNVARFAARGVRYLGLVHFSRNQLAAPTLPVPMWRATGLSGFGRAVIGELDRLGVVLDLAHINRRGFFEALDVATKPVMVSHTGLASVHPCWRNIDDDQLRAIAETGGCVGVIFAPQFLGGPGLEAVCDHLLHIIRVAGEDTPALGSDFDGFVIPPRDLGDVAALPALTAALARRGLTPATLRKLLGANALRVLGEPVPRA
jgi:membrane dipeptidase